MTCFFIDTANNVIEYIELIYNLLVDGGLWINMGPLLYHFDSHPTELSVELSLAEIIRLSRTVGFEIVDGSSYHLTTYCQLPESMMKNVYNSVFFVAQKASNKLLEP